MYLRIVRVGLLESRSVQASVTLGELLARFIDAADVKPATLDAYRQTTNSLRDYFGADAAIETLTASHAESCRLMPTHADSCRLMPTHGDSWRLMATHGDSWRLMATHGDSWRKAIAESGIAGATVAKRVHVAKSIFRKAIKWELIPASPFEDLRAGSQANPERSFYVTHESVKSVLAECPDNQWRGIIALSRELLLNRRAFRTKCDETRRSAKQRITAQKPKNGRRRIRTSSINTGNSEGTEKIGAKIVPLRSDSYLSPTPPKPTDSELAALCPTDSELAAVVAAWPMLPLAVKAGIMAMVRCK